MKIKTDPIDSDRLYSIEGSLRLREFARQCEQAMTEPKLCRLVPVYERIHGKPENGHPRYFFDRMCDISILLDEYLYIECLHDENMEKEAKDIIRCYKSIDWQKKGDDFSVLDGFRQRSVDLADAIVRKKSVDIQTIIFISPDKTGMNHCHSVYHNGKLRSLAPFDYESHFMKFIMTPFPHTGFDGISEVGRAGFNQDLHYVYSDAFEKRYYDLRHDERGLVIPIDPYIITSLETMGLDGSDFVDLGNYYSWGDINYKIEEYKKNKAKRKRETFLDCVSAAVPF